jgi:hypothetical protein
MSCFSSDVDDPGIPQASGSAHPRLAHQRNKPVRWVMVVVVVVDVDVDVDVDVEVDV